MCNFGRWQYGEHSCEIIINLDQWFRCCFKIFLKNSIFSSGGHFAQWSEMVCAILVEGIMKKRAFEIIKQWFRSRCCL